MKPYQYHHLIHALKFAYPVSQWRNGWCVYQQGVFDMTDLLSAQQEILLAKRSVIDLQYALHLQLLELERLTGLPMVVNGPEALTKQHTLSDLPPQQELSQ